MRVVVRADAGPQRGTGHVMRCLTVAEALIDIGHDVALVGEIDDVDWLSRHVNSVGIEHITCERDQLALKTLKSLGAERLVVDSYWIDPTQIAAADALVPTMAIVDNDLRGIRATWYLDQNLGAEAQDWSGVTGTVLAGSRYALVRQAVLEQRDSRGWEIPGRDSHVVAFMGGTDPGGVMTQVVKSIAGALPRLRLTAITTEAQFDSVREAAATMPYATVMGPTPDLPVLLGTADVVVSAAGTSSWDVCSMGKAAVLVGVVENQSSGLAHALESGLATGVDATVHGAVSVGALLKRLLDDAAMRESIVRAANETFDGLGSRRVATALTA